MELDHSATFPLRFGVGDFLHKKAACCKGRRLIHKKKYLSERGNQILLGSIIIIGIHKKSCNFNTHYCETTLLAISGWHSKTRASHTYYTVVSGDSWWAIAKQFSVDMNTLVKLNGKTIDSIIHPGDKLIIK
nr:LysM domain-containing protein [Lactiplantibacillus plantarum]